VLIERGVETEETLHPEGSAPTDRRQRVEISCWRTPEINMISKTGMSAQKMPWRRWRCTQ
jgi:hypothetical protein